MDTLEKIFENFDFKGKYVDYRTFGNGHINTTYIVRYDLPDGNVIKYIVQKVNHNVFKNVDDLMDNIFSVTSFLRDKIRDYGGDEDRETLHFITTKSGDKYYTDEEGDYYRAYVFVRNSTSYDAVDSPELFRKSGSAFGKFQRLLSDFPAETLNETIPNFHNTVWRYRNEFIPAVRNDVARRAQDVVDEIAFVTNRADDMHLLTDLASAGQLPLRVTHNDTKLNNVIFDEDTDEAICVIDLDTVMPGLAHYDFGDSIRFGANTAAEDEEDLSKVSINLDYFKAYAEGFLAEAGDSLNQYEIDNLAFSAKLMTLECGMRFLTDYLNGDTYFKTAYPEHNLVRARNQFKLVEDMEDKMSKMEKIIRNVSNK